MSTTIDFARAAFKYVATQLPEAMLQRLEAEFVLHRHILRDGYLLLAQFSDNRTFDDQGRTARQWKLMAIGDYRQVLSAAMDSGKDVIGGMLQFRNGLATPHGYVKCYEKAIAEARPLDDLVDRGWVSAITLARFGAVGSGSQQKVERLTQEFWMQLERSRAGLLATHLIEALRLQAIDKVRHTEDASVDIELRLTGESEDAELAKVFLMLLPHMCSEITSLQPRLHVHTVQALGRRGADAFSCLVP